MRNAIFASLSLGLVFTACRPTTADRERACGDVDIHVEAVASLDEASGATVRGTIRTVALSDGELGDGGAPATEGAVHDVYVGGVRVTRTEFNFRAFTATVPKDVVCAHVSEARSTLRIRAYLFGEDGLCAYESPSGLTIDIPNAYCEDSGGQGGGGGAEPVDPNGTGGTDNTGGAGGTGGG